LIGVTGTAGLTLAENYYIMGTAPAEDENFCLRWNDYEKKYAETFRTLRNFFALIMVFNRKCQGV
jgi:hypothetical protein